MSNMSASNMTDLSDQRPATFQTFASRESPIRRADGCHERRGVNIAQPRVTSVHLPQREQELERYHGDSICQNSCYDSRPYSRCGTETSYADTDAGMQYSCADMSDGLTSKTPSRFDVTDKESDETTTSGSYIVDPQQLCNEIDDLFFRDMLV